MFATMFRAFCFLALYKATERLYNSIGVNGWLNTLAFTLKALPKGLYEGQRWCESYEP